RLPAGSTRLRRLRRRSTAEASEYLVGSRRAPLASLPPITRAREGLRRNVGIRTATIGRASSAPGAHGPDDAMAFPRPVRGATKRQGTLAPEPACAQCAKPLRPTSRAG